MIRTQVAAPSDFWQNFSELVRTNEENDMTQPAPQVSPQPIWQIMTAFQMSAAYKSAIEIELFTKIAEGNKTEAALASACGAAERGVRILADTMTVLGLLSKHG